LPESHNTGPTPLVLLLCLFCPPLGLLAWIFGSGQRSAYLSSSWVRAGLTLLLLGSAPLVGVILVAELGLWPDPNPNPVGPGLLFFFGGVAGTLCLAIGAVSVWLTLRRT